ncbi:hypothetical protein ScPMuIL_012469 [Solemya velum]
MNQSATSSIINLKAELLRKQEEFKKQKLENQHASYVKVNPSERTQKMSIFDRQNTGVLLRAQADFEAKVEEEDDLLKSKKSLEAKAKLYEKMCQSTEIPEEDGSKYYLVDFQKKVIDDIVEKRNAEKEAKEKELGSSDETEVEVPIPAAPGEEWVDYIDSFGRTRKCMKKDLPEWLKRDQTHSGEVKTGNVCSNPTLLSEDMRREMLREKWEKEEEAQLNMPAGPIHYANVQFNEVRNHGVGYYQFADRETARQEQLDSLNNLRKETVDQRARKDRIKDKRKAMLEARLAKVKQRKKLRDGGLLNTDHPEAKEESGDEDVGPKLSEQSVDRVKDTPTQPKLLVRDESWKKTATVREWDKGKERLFAKTAEEYIESRREDRPSEFAPPSLYMTSNVSKTRHSKKPGEKGSVTYVLGPPDAGNALNEHSTSKKAFVGGVDSNSDCLSDIPLPPESMHSSVSKLPEHKTKADDEIGISPFTYMYNPNCTANSDSMQGQPVNLEWNQDSYLQSQYVSSGQPHFVSTGHTQNVPPSVQPQFVPPTEHSQYTPFAQNSQYVQSTEQSQYVTSLGLPQYAQSTQQSQFVASLETTQFAQSTEQPQSVIPEKVHQKVPILDTRHVQNEEAFVSEHIESLETDNKQ